MEENQIIAQDPNYSDSELTIELESDLLNNTLIAKKFLIGKILAPKLLNRGAVKSILAKAWSDYGDFQITDMGINLFLFSFIEKKEITDILQKGPWYVMGHLLSLQFWVPEAAIYDINIDRVSFWIQIHGLPLEVMKTSNAAKIISSFGEVLEVENPEVEGKLLRTFMRVRALIDIKKPFVTGCWVPIKNLPKAWIILKYERLQALCFNCGVIGHEQKTCKNAKVVSHFGRTVPKYNAKLGVPPAKTILQQFQEQGEWRKTRASMKENIHRDPEESSEQAGGLAQTSQGAAGPTESEQPQTSQPDQRGSGRQKKRKGAPKQHQTNVRAEFYGPSKEKVLLDHPSPATQKYEGANLGPAEVFKCREIILKSFKKKSQKEPNLDTAENSPAYFVEFPKEEEINEGMGAEMKTILKEEESQLIVGLNNCLTLKRGRDNFESHNVTMQGEGTNREGGGPKHAPPSAMICLSWNCRGMAAASTIRELKELYSYYKPSIVFLSETKATSRKVEQFRRKLRFHQSFCVEANGLSGGLALFWRHPIDIHISNYNNNFIHTTINTNDSPKVWEATFLYGSPRARDGRNFWYVLRGLHADNQTPWCLMGYFNELLSQSEKEGLHPPNTKGMELFNKFVSDSGLMDLHLKGCKFTWLSNQRNGFVTRERLDRILVNWPWRDVYQNAMAIALPPVSSDHSPIIMWTNPKMSKGRQFKFEAMWEENVECKGVIRNGWTEIEATSTPAEKFLNKAKNCKTALSHWHQRTFRSPDKQLAQLTEELQMLLNQEIDQDPNYWVKLQDLRKQIDGVRKQKENFWAQRSRVKWLQHGDRNSKFFHASTVQRRDRNRLFRLKNDLGEWMEGQEAMEELILAHFQQIYKSDGAINFKECEEVIQKNVTDDLNTKLLRPVSEEEVKLAVFSMDALKAPGPDSLNGLFYQNHWEDLKNDVFAVVADFFNTGALNDELNETLVALVPKTLQPESL
ncbi:Zinc finger, CCHC-type [Sesbania bispinosa]|nr:Zinc finger, CCHC-type [Sesbania bispinosa]